MSILLNNIDINNLCIYVINKTSYQANGLNRIRENDLRL